MFRCFNYKKICHRKVDCNLVVSCSMDAKGNGPLVSMFDDVVSDIIFPILVDKTSPTYFVGKFVSTLPMLLKFLTVKEVHVFLPRVEGNLGSRVGVEGSEFLSRDPLGVKEFPLFSPREFSRDLSVEDVSPLINIVPSFQSDEYPSLGGSSKSFLDIAISSSLVRDS